MGAASARHALANGQTWLPIAPELPKAACRGMADLFVPDRDPRREDERDDEPKAICRTCPELGPAVATRSRIRAWSAFGAV